MGNPRVNKYRSSKNPERQVITSENTDGTFTTVVFDAAHGRIISHTFPDFGKNTEVVDQEHQKKD